MAEITKILFEPAFIFALTFVVVIIAIIILTVIERRLKKKLEVEKQKAEFFQNKIMILKHAAGTPERLLLLLDALARDFFYEEFRTPKELTGSERMFYFQKRNQKIARFYEEMQKALYAGENVDKRKALALIEQFESLVEEKRAAAQKRDSLKESLNPPWPLSIFVKKHNSPRTKPTLTETADRLIPNQFVKQKIPIKTKTYPSPEPHHYKYIQNIDDLERIKTKIHSRKNLKESN